MFAKEGEGGEAAENRIDMRPMREREKGKGEGTLGESGAKEEERGCRERTREKHREREKRSPSRKGNAESETRSWKWGELASAESEKGAGKGGEGRQLQARSSVASGARERERERESAVGRGGREQCHGGQCLAGGCPSTCSLASLPDSAPQCFQSRVHRWVEPRSSSELLKLATLGSHHHVADKKWNRIRDPVDRPRNPSRRVLANRKRKLCVSRVHGFRRETAGERRRTTYIYIYTYRERESVREGKREEERSVRGR